MRWFKAEKVIAMKELRYLAAMLIVCGIALPALAQEQVALTIYVHEGDLDGDLLEGSPSQERMQAAMNSPR